MILDTIILVHSWLTFHFLQIFDLKRNLTQGRMRKPSLLLTCLICLLIPADALTSQPATWLRSNSNLDCCARKENNGIVYQLYRYSSNQTASQGYYLPFQNPRWLQSPDWRLWLPHRLDIPYKIRNMSTFWNFGFYANKFYKMRKFNLNLVSGCVYVKEGDSSGDQFCFEKNGDYLSSCLAGEFPINFVERGPPWSKLSQQIMVRLLPWPAVAVSPLQLRLVNAQKQQQQQQSLQLRIYLQQNQQRQW